MIVLRRLNKTITPTRAVIIQRVFLLACTLSLITGREVWKESISTGGGVLTMDRVPELGNAALYSIHGTATNDLLLQVAGGTYRHWNGASW